MQSSAKIRLIAAAFTFATLVHAQTPQPTADTQQSLHRAEVTYTDGRLSVSANNSSLNQILRDIVRETKMKITGGVTDERVFGQYGPDVPSKVLGELLDGTGSNMLLLQATTATPAELILTPRHGGPTPPNPNAYQNDPPPQYVPSVPEGNVRQPSPAPQSARPSPNDVRTPQQIYEQLQRIHQQQLQQQPNPQ